MTRPPISLSDLADPILYLVLLSIVIAGLTYSASRTSASASATLECENARAAQIREVREVSIADLDAIEAECARIRRTK